MVVIGHRGAAGLAPENTIVSIDEAIDAGVDGIEFDIQLTRDNRFILMHDTSLYRITGNTAHVSDLTLKQINTISTKSGHPIPSLEEALEHVGKIPVMIDCKGKNWAKPLDRESARHRSSNLSVSSDNVSELYAFKLLRSGVETFFSEHTKPMSAVYTARMLGFSGITLNFWILNPLSYLYAKRYGLRVLVYTVNRPVLAKFLRFFYPSATIITDYPNKLAKLSKRRTKK